MNQHIARALCALYGLLAYGSFAALTLEQMVSILTVSYLP